MLQLLHDHLLGVVGGPTEASESRAFAGREAQSQGRSG
jgi:hypothetical protein